MIGYLIILGAGPDQIPAYIQAKKLGINTIAVDYNPDSVAFDYADKILVASVKHIKETISALKKLNETYIGVMTLGVEISPIVAAVAKEFGLISVSEQTAFLTTNKCARNEFLNQTKIQIANYQVVTDIHEVNLNYPFVIKPSDNSASRGVQLVDSVDELKRVFDSSKKLSSDKQLLIEEYLSGPEISIEGFMLNGKMYVTGFADRNYSRNPEFYPFFVEDGGDYPTFLSQDIVAEAKKVFEQAALALGITEGPSKGDLIVTDSGVKVIEITSRLSGGGFCSRIVPLQTGVDIVRATIQWACGLTVFADDFIPKYNKAISHRFFFHKPGKIKAIKGLDKIKEMPGIVDVVIQRPFDVGDVLEPVSYANRLFYVIAIADDRETAIKYATDAIASVEIDIEGVS